MSRPMDLVAALGLALAIEGVLMAVAPGIVRQGALSLAAMRSSGIRASGVAAAGAGLALVWLVRG